MSWIKLHRALQQHWLWTDPERLKWWFDLLFMAEWRPRQIMHDAHIITLHPGQMVAPVSLLCQKWQKNHTTVIRYLKILESEGMIERKVLYRQTSIITICNYDRYQAAEDDAVDTLTSALVDGTMDSTADTSIDMPIDAQVYTTEEYIEYSTTSSKKTSKEKPTAENAASQSIQEQLYGNERWQAQIARKHGMQQHEVEEQLDAFFLDVECRGTQHKNLTDAKRHFTDWLAIQQEQKERLPNKGKKAKPQQQQTATVYDIQEAPSQSKEDAYKERMLGLIELVTKNPQSSCMRTLRSAYQSGELAKAGIQWCPPGEQTTAADIISADPNGRLAKIFNQQ